jgi:hypothetical protein
MPDKLRRLYTRATRGYGYDAKSFVIPHLMYIYIHTYMYIYTHTHILLQTQA